MQALIDILKELVEQNVAGHTFDAHFGNKCAYCGRVYAGFNDRYPHTPTCPITRARELLNNPMPGYVEFEPMSTEAYERLKEFWFSLSPEERKHRYVMINADGTRTIADWTSED